MISWSKDWTRKEKCGRNSLCKDFSQDQLRTRMAQWTWPTGNARSQGPKDLFGKTGFIDFTWIFPRTILWSLRDATSTLCCLIRMCILQELFVSAYWTKKRTGSLLWQSETFCKEFRSFLKRNLISSLQRNSSQPTCTSKTYRNISSRQRASQWNARGNKQKAE